jgi:hypothetical protein
MSDLLNIAAAIALGVVIYAGLMLLSYLYLIHTPQDPSNPHRRVREGWWSCIALVALGLALASPSPARAGGNTTAMNSCMYSAIGPATRDRIMGIAMRQAAGDPMTPDEAYWWGMQVIAAAAACNNMAAMSSDPSGIAKSFGAYFTARWAAEKGLRS